MDEVGLREMRQKASELIRRVEAGESVTITVAGRPAAVISPVSRQSWRRWSEVADAFQGTADPQWESDMALVDGTLADPWQQR